MASTQVRVQLNWFSLLVVLLNLAVPPANSQSRSDDCGCNAVLAKDLFSFSYTEKQQWAFLSLITKETFNQYKQNISVLAAIPIAKEMVEASADFTQFSESRSKYFKKVQYSGSYERDYRELNMITAPIAYPEWGKCMQACAKQRVGLFAWKEKEDKDVVVIAVYYHGAPNGPEKALLKSNLVGGTVSGAPSGKLFSTAATIPKNGEESVIIKRLPGKAVTATVSAAGFTATPPIYSTWLENPPPGGETVERPVYELTPGGITPTHGDGDRASRHPGCDCGPATMKVDPLSQDVKRGEYAGFTWDGTWICRGQSIKDASGTVWFDGQTAARLPESYGRARVKYGDKGSVSHVVLLEYSGTCYDNGSRACEQHCTTKVTTTINVREK